MRCLTYPLSKELLVHADCDRMTSGSAKLVRQTICTTQTSSNLWLMMLCWIMCFPQAQARRVPIMPVSYDVAFCMDKCPYWCMACCCVLCLAESIRHLAKTMWWLTSKFVLNTWFNLVNLDMTGFRKSAHKMLSFTDCLLSSWFRILLVNLCAIAFWKIVPWPTVIVDLISLALHGEIAQRIAFWVVRRKKEYKAI